MASVDDRFRAIQQSMAAVRSCVVVVLRIPLRKILRRKTSCVKLPRVHMIQQISQPLKKGGVAECSSGASTASGGGSPESPETPKPAVLRVITAQHLPRRFAPDLD